MQPQPHLLILKRAGAVLLGVGLLDITVMAYCIANQISYVSSLNIFAVVAGVFLLRGSLRAASIVRWMAMFMLAGLLALSCVWPFIEPIDLTLTVVQLRPLASAGLAVFIALMLFLLYWLHRELGAPSVLQARIAAGRKLRDMRVPATAGIAIVSLLGVCMKFWLGGESAAKAKSIAQQQWGAAYNYHVSSLSIAKNSRGTFVTGVVTAWNKQEIRSVPVQWEER